MYDIKLSPHFVLSEFTRSSTAAAHGIDNTPTLGSVSNLQYLCEKILEPLRAHANQPIIINSGYRCLQLNKAIGGVSTSNHLSGYAADIKVPNNKVGEEWFDWMQKNIPDFDELILERNTPSSPTFWIHVAIRQNGNNRKKVIRNLIAHPSPPEGRDVK
ncbi:MAG: D-Ala-D-Ala carboxypeptidase family metallohydrolase [Bacteroidaceae bacterium]|nr:D-Ala-D-Ala carboxypeptidase family metallohydrolase [Bacteroidaceae bacterium]